MSSEQIGEALNFIIEQTEVDLVFFDENPISIDFPTSVDLKVVSSPPGVKILLKELLSLQYWKLVLRFQYHYLLMRVMS